ncbi:MAG TPA: VWA domain-containing protein [Candidatus Acidoferrales bacterium]|nr:VWA domain-containing protein [Candidatus Acidoferrales bacterium]
MDWFFSIRFSQPLCFAGLLLLPLIWLGWRASARAVLLWRSVIFVLLLAALAGPERVRPTVRASGPDEEPIVALDLSRSISRPMREWMRKAVAERFSASAPIRWLVFAGGARAVDDGRAWLSGEAPAAEVRPEQTNLEALFAELLRERDRERSVFLLTDGWENAGEIERLLPALAASRVKVFPLVPTETIGVANVEVKKVIAPHRAVAGESVTVKVFVENHNAREVEGTLALARNGQTVKEERLRLKPGSHVLTYQSSVSGDSLNSFQATFSAATPGADLYGHDNRSVAWTAAETKEKVLLLNGQREQGKYLEEILRRRGFEVTAVSPNGSPPPAPNGYAVVIFNNVERERLPGAYLAAIERHVAAGNGFVMLGGDHSFGPGGYRDTPIETVLPVELREPKKEEKNRAFVLVIDKSGSMREDNRILFAREAAKAMVRQLKDNDLLAVVGFDISAFVVVPMARVDRLRGDFDYQIDRLKPGGRTYLLPAVIEAKRLLERERADQKHVIILSDGETGGSQGDYIDLVSVMKQESKITVSAVAIGDQANIPLLKRISQYGGGFFHHTYDPRTLPQLVTQQVRERPQPESPAERDYLPLALRGSELLAQFRERAYPPVRGFIETEIKRGAELDIAVAKDDRRFPLLASWRYGRGKSVAFATDMQGHWTRSWIPWSGLQDFWGAIFDWLRPPRESVPPHEVRINIENDRPVLDLYVFQETNGGSQFRYELAGRGSKHNGILKRIAPGRYQTELPISAPGDYRIELAEVKGAERKAYPTVGYTLAFSPRSEVPKPNVNVALLEKLARATGGEINPAPKSPEKTNEVLFSAEPLRTPLIFAAGVLFLLEIMFRRFFPPFAAY